MDEDALPTTGNRIAHFIDQIHQDGFDRLEFPDALPDRTQMLGCKALDVLAPVAALEQLGESLTAVDGHAEDLADCPLAWEPTFLRVESEAGAQQIDDILCVSAIEDREVGIHAEGSGVLPEHRVGKRMEGPSGYAVTPFHQGRCATQHLLRCSSREREQEDLGGAADDLHEHLEIMHRADVNSSRSH